MEYTIDRQYVESTLQDMVRINSVNPGLAPDGPGEREMAHYLGDRMRELGMEVSVYEVASKYWNAVGVLKGTGGGKSLMLTGHMDTVGVGGMVDPFSAEIRDGKLYGRGACDMKTGLAAALGAVKALREAGIHPAGDVIVAGAADEEYLSIGSENLAATYKTDAVVVAEPSGLSIVRAHKGFIWFEVITTGRAMHGSNYADGVDAIVFMGRFLTELEQVIQEQQNRAPAPLLGPPSLHASLIRGGTELSTYPPSCTLTIEWRTIPGQTEEELRGKLQRIIDRLHTRDEKFKAEVRTLFVRHPFEVPEDSPIVQTIHRQTEKITGSAPQYFGMAGWADTSLFDRAGMPALIYGPDGEGAHADVEWADLESLYTTANVFAATILDFCGIGAGQ